MCCTLLAYIFCYSSIVTHLYSVTHRQKLPPPPYQYPPPQCITSYLYQHTHISSAPPTAYINAHTPKSGTWYVSFRLQRYYIFFEYPNFSGDFCTEKCRIECLSIGYREPRIQREKPLFGVCSQFLMRAREKEQKHN